MDIQGTLDLTGLHATLGAVQAITSDWTDFFQKEAEGAFEDWQTQVFRTQGAVNGTPWKQWGWLGNFVHSKTGYNRGGIGESTGKMMDSLTKRGDPNARVEITNSTFVRGSNATSPYDGNYPELFVQDHWVTQLWGKPLRRPIEVPGRELTPENVPSFLVDNLNSLLDNWFDKHISSLP
jgi:hypothetical protein